jgi:hypothetical protein
MTYSQYGFAGLNKNFNSNSSNDNLIKRIDQLELKLIPARVIDIILDETHPNFINQGEWKSIGNIVYELINSPENPIIAANIAKPLLSNNKHFPLKNEIVFLIRLPNTTSLNNLTDNESYYYLTTLALWNHPHHNAFPNPLNNPSISESQRKDYKSIEEGNIRKVNNTSTEIDLNATNNSGGKFIEKTNIRPLLPFTGDVLYEGRFGNSIRLGSTIKSKSKFSNNWSTSGTEGDPILILRNGQLIESNSEGWIPLVEDINKDLSSIYFTSTQKIPIEVSSKNYTGIRNELIPSYPNSYNKPQIILNSGRLLFNSTTDSILFSSKKVISLSAIEDIGLSTRANINLSANNIRIGGPQANESLILGDSFMKQFNVLLDSLSLLCEALATEAACLSSTPLVATGLSNVIKSIKNVSGDLTSKISKTL